MPNVNRVIIAGHLTRDPDLKHTPKGNCVTNLGVAVNRKFKTPEGEWKSEPTFLDVTVWGKQAESCVEYLSKGRAIFVDGQAEE